MNLRKAIYKDRKKRRLADIDVDEISLVDRAASGHAFTIMKGSDEELAAVLEAYQDEAFTAVLKGGDEAAVQAALKEALEIIKPYIDDFPDKVKAAVKTLGSFAGMVVAETYGGEKDKASDDEGGEEKPVKKSMGEGFRAFAAGILGAGNPRLFERIYKSADGVEDEELDNSDSQEPHSRRGLSLQVKEDPEDLDLEKSDEPLWPSLCHQE